MGVKTAAPNLIAARLGDKRLAKTSKDRTNEHNGASQVAAFNSVLLSAQVVKVYAFSLENATVTAEAVHLYPHIAYKLNKVVYVGNVRNIVNGNLIRCEQSGAYNLQRLILGSLRGYTAA